MHGLLPWALAGLAGWFIPKVLNLREDWQRALVALLAGALVGWLVGCGEGLNAAVVFSPFTYLAPGFLSRPGTCRKASS